MLVRYTVQDYIICFSMPLFFTHMFLEKQMPSFLDNWLTCSHLGLAGSRWQHEAKESG